MGLEHFIADIKEYGKESREEFEGGDLSKGDLGLYFLWTLLESILTKDDKLPFWGWRPKETARYRIDGDSEEGWGVYEIYFAMRSMLGGEKGTTREEQWKAQDRVNRLEHYNQFLFPKCPAAFAEVREILMQYFESERISGEHREEMRGYGKALPSGAYLFGDSYLGKSTAAWWFARAFALSHAINWLEDDYSKDPKSRKGESEAPHLVRWIEAGSFANIAKAKAKASDLEQFTDSLVSFPLLVIDDFDKLQLSESVEVAFFDVLKQRIESDQFTIITANQKVSRLSKRFGQDRRAPIENRIRENFAPVKFDTQVEETGDRSRQTLPRDERGAIPRHGVIQDHENQQSDANSKGGKSYET